MVCLAHQQPPSDIASGSNEKPVQPSQSTVQFPPLVGTKKRYFNPDWFKMYSWLEYFVEKDAAFCFPCRHFSTKSGRAEDTFTKKGFRNWKKATGKEGIFITTSTFTPSAAKEAKSNVALIDGKELVRLMEEYGVGVSEVENITIKALSGEYFEQFK